MYIKDIERAKSYESIREMWADEPPTRIAIAALLSSGYTYQQTYEMMKQHYYIDEKEFYRNLKIYNLKELS